jgi:hypothetical protein
MLQLRQDDAEVISPLHRHQIAVLPHFNGPPVPVQMLRNVRCENGRRALKIVILATVWRAAPPHTDVSNSE